MKTRKLLLLNFLWIALSTFSQENYPKKIVIESDTVVCITPDQLERVNLLIVDYQQCKELAAAEKTQILKLDGIVSKQDEIIRNHEEKEEILKQMVKVKEDEANKLQRSLKRQKIKTKIVGVGSFLIGAAAMYFIVH